MRTDTEIVVLKYKSVDGNDVYLPLEAWNHEIEVHPSCKEPTIHRVQIPVKKGAYK